MDAIALGMPVVTNRKAAFAKEISENGLGVLFDSTEESMRKVLLESLTKYTDYTEKNENFLSESYDCRIFKKIENLHFGIVLNKEKQREG